MTTEATQTNKTSWPIKLYLGAVTFAFFTMAVFTPTLSGAAANVGRVRTQAGICLVFVLRLLWAVYIKEQSKTWRIYITCMFLAVPIWLLIEPWVHVLR